MADLTASAIATLAFLDHLSKTEAGKVFVEGMFKKLGEETLKTGLEKINSLRKAIWDRLRGNSDAEKALTKAISSDVDAVKEVAHYLQALMEQDQDFAVLVRQMAEEIQSPGQSQQVQHQTVQSGGVGYQTQTGSKNTNFFGGTHYHGAPPDT